MLQIKLYNRITFAVKFCRVSKTHNKITKDNKAIPIICSNENFKNFSGSSH